MGGTEMTSYCLAVAGLALVVTAVIAMARRTIDVVAGNSVLARLAHDGKLERIVKLCASAPHTYFDAVMAATLSGAPLRGRARGEIRGGPGARL